MVILVIAANDAATNDNLTVAGPLAAHAAVALLGNDAVNDNVNSALTILPVAPLLAFSHGKKDHLVGHDGQPYVSLVDIPLLQGRVTFAYACYTAEIIGRQVSEAGGIWFGYAGPVNCLPAEPEVIGHFQAISEFIYARFPACNDRPTAEQFVADLDDLVQRTFALFDGMGTATMEQLHALRDIVYRLRIWLSGEDAPVQHRQSFGDTII